MKFFHREKKKSLSEIQGVPDGTFLCDVCKFVLPNIYYCGAVLDAHEGDQPKTYILCGVCAMWLGFREHRFPQGVCFNFSDEQYNKTRVLQREHDIAEKELIPHAQDVNPSAEYREKLHNLVERMPNFIGWSKLRDSMLPSEIRELSVKLTGGEFVAPSEIRKANK